MMKETNVLKIGLGILGVIVLVVLEMMFGIVSGTSGLIPLGIDPDLQLLAVMGILTVFMLTVFLFIKKSYKR